MIDVIQFQSTELECEKSFNLRHHVNMIRPRLQDSSELISDVSTKRCTRTKNVVSPSLCAVLKTIQIFF